eukprot:scaffold225670_cov31-Tisochrysis_lutea.AAC.1
MAKALTVRSCPSSLAAGAEGLPRCHTRIEVSREAETTPLSHAALARRVTDFGCPTHLSEPPPAAQRTRAIVPESSQEIHSPTRPEAHTPVAICLWGLRMRSLSPPEHAASRSSACDGAEPPPAEEPQFPIAQRCAVYLSSLLH